MKLILVIKKLLGLVEMTTGLVNASFRLPKRQAVKMIFFAPCTRYSSVEWRSHEGRGQQPKKKKQRLLTHLEQMKYALASQRKYDWLMREALTTNLSIIKTINKLMTAEALQNLCHGF